ncbi:hypothetical protein GCM10010330_80080 [Streptomyces tendae]|nr:hypothetical protein GCM10010330_80080 [Streptomyces tendae]
MKNPDSKREPPRLRRVHLPGTVPQPPAPDPSTGDEEELPGTDTYTDTGTEPASEAAG